MIAQHLRRGLGHHGKRLLLIHGDQQCTYAEMASWMDALIEQWADLEGQRVGLSTLDPATFMASILALDALRAHVFLTGQRSRQECEPLREAFEWQALLEPANVRLEVPPRARASNIRSRPIRVDTQVTSTREAAVGAVTILTSGTTGLPKSARHTWDSLARPVRTGEEYIDTRWLCPYPLHLYAGIQVFLQVFLNWATVVVPTTLEPEAVTSALLDHQVQYASGTPTLWRRLLIFGGGGLTEERDLRQITMGGESAPQGLLSRLRETFPKARIVHIYASTEMGRLFSVTDGREGFPISYLTEPPEPGIELRVTNGQLVVRSQNSMQGYDSPQPNSVDAEGWFATGDLVEISGDRVLFRGRTTEIINVGGNKVLPSEVEAVVQTIPGVGQVRVYPKRSSLAGQLIAVDIVLSPGYQADHVRAAVQQASRQRLRPYQIPRVIRFVDRIATNAACKILRKDTSS